MTPDELLNAVFKGKFRANERPAISRQLENGLQPVWAWPDAKIDGHTHLSVGLFEWNTTRVARDGFKRRFERCTGLATLLLDDIHEKAIPPDLAPTIKIETKPGSEQWLYVFKEPLRDLEAAAQMMAALVDAGHADKGGSLKKTASIRLGRLPGSDPKGNGYPARVIWHDMSRQFLPDPKLLFGPKGFNLPLGEKPNLTTSAQTKFIAAGNDPLLKWLNANRYVLGEQASSGWVPIICPWHHTHTGQAVTGTDYLPATPRGFHCFHGHCQDKNPVDFLTWAVSKGYQPPTPTDPRKPQQPNLDMLFFDGWLNARAWDGRHYEGGAWVLAQDLARNGICGPDIALTLTTHTNTPTPIANALATHARDLYDARLRFWQEEREVRTVTDDMEARLSEVMDVDEDALMAAVKKYPVTTYGTP